MAYAENKLNSPGAKRMVETDNEFLLRNEEHIYRSISASLHSNTQMLPVFKRELIVIAIIIKIMG
jgi:hypothetical protein